jgi:hypothetical protein
MGRNRTLGSPLEIQYLTASLSTTEPHIDVYAVDAPMGSPVAVTLDASPFSGDQLLVVDIGLNAAGQPIVIQASPGQSIIGFGASVSITASGGSVQLTFSEAFDAWIPVFGGSSGGGASCGELVALVTDTDASVDALFPGANACHNLTVIYQGFTTTTRTLTLPAAPFIGERVTVTSDGNFNRPVNSAVVQLSGGANSISVTGVPPTSPVPAITIPALISNIPSFSSVTVLWDGVTWVEVAIVPSIEMVEVENPATPGVAKAGTRSGSRLAGSRA